MISEGWGRCAGYRRTDASRSSRAAFVFEGVDAEVFGDRGFLGGGAAGFEIDRTTPWTPRHALILAASFGHTGNYDLGLEREAMFIELRERPERDPVRAEMVFFETEGGGAVFSVGSIAWNGSLSYDGYDNDVARITANVLRRFRDPAPFKPPPDTRGGSDHADSHS
jgi:N,N-dimethylformamidase